jgi:membrane protein implicated in regulation of membrane protease activity
VRAVHVKLAVRGGKQEPGMHPRDLESASTFFLSHVLPGIDWVHARLTRAGGPAAMDLWVIWLIIAVLLGVAEIFTLTTALGLLGGAAVIASASAAIGLPVPLQLILFAAASAAGVFTLRPIAQRHLSAPQRRDVGMDALVGKPAYVLREVTGRDGRVRIGGEEWTARAIDDSIVIPAGATANVLQIDGATAVVYPRE